MRRVLLAAWAVVICILALTGCGSGHGSHGHLWITRGGGHRLAACVSTDCGPYSVTLHWQGVSIAGQTGYFVYLNGTQVADVTTTSYVYFGTDCGTTITLGVRAHDGSGGTSALFTATYTTPACSGGGGGAPVFTPNIFIGQSAAGTGDGSSCANQKAVSALSTATYWTAGNVIGLCGTITSPITAQGSGTSANPIVVYWEPGASMTEPTSSCSSQCFNISGQSNITLDGGSNGVITVPNNGDSAATNVGVRGIAVSNASNITIEYLTIRNLYVATQNVTKSPTGEDPAGIWVINANNFLLDHNTISYVGDVGVIFVNTTGITTPQTISNNDFSGENWEIASGGNTGAAQGSVYIFGNRFGDTYNWDTTNDAWHHNGIFCYTAGAGFAPHYDGWYIYNNLFDGTPSNASPSDSTSWINIQDCSDDITNFYAFNDIFASVGSEPGNGDDAQQHAVAPSYNDTFIGTNTGQGLLLNTQESGQHDVRNVLSVNGYSGELSRSGCGGGPSPGGFFCPLYSFNNNMYVDTNGNSNTGFLTAGTNVHQGWSTGWSAWLSSIASFPTTTPASAQDETNSFGPPGSSQTVTDPKLDANDAPIAGSPALSTGQNLTSICSGQPNPGLGALCSTYAGPTPSANQAGPNGTWATPTARPTTGAWNIGAY